MIELSKNPDDPRPVAMETLPPDELAANRTLTTVSSPPNDGMTSGGGVYPDGATVTVVATPNVDKHFVQWTYINGLTASVHPNYTFSITNDTNLVANFAEGAIIPPPPEIQGPLNLFIERVGHAEALNRAHATKEQYERLGFDFGQPEVKSDPPPPMGTPISAGGPIDTPIDGVKYVLDISTAAARRRR